MLNECSRFFVLQYSQSSELFYDMNERRADSITKQAAVCLLPTGILKFLKISKKRRRHWVWEWTLLRDECGADY